VLHRTNKNDVQKRWHAHVKDALDESPLYFHRALRKYPIETWKCEILESVETKQEANIREIYWISHFRSNDPNLGDNMTSGGEGVDMTDEVLLKISEAMKGRIMTDDHKRKIADSTEQF
jgi:hypothetical protein